MDIPRDSGAALYVPEFGGRKHLRLALLDVRTLGELQGRMPEPERERLYLSPWDIYRWSRTAGGAVHAIYLSMRDAGHDVTVEDVEAMGSVQSRVVLAAEIVARSITTGEEPLPKEGEPDKAAPFVVRTLRKSVTGLAKRLKSLASRPVSATRTG